MNDFLSKVSAAALETQAEMRKGNSGQRMRDYSERNLYGGWKELNVDLSTLTDRRLFSLQGKQMVVAVIGSSPAAVNIFFNNASNPNLLAPGMTYRGPFVQFSLERILATSGNLRILITDDDDAIYTESAASSNSAGVQNVQAQISRATAQQTYNAAKYANNPTAMTAAERKLYCIDASLSKYIRILASCTGTPNITAGTVLLWVYDLTNAFWYASGIEIPLQTGTGRVSTGDYEMGVQNGLIWPEVYGLTNAAAGGDIFVYARAS